MIVGTCARSPAPATSPIELPSFRCVHGVLHLAVEVEAPGAALPADPGVPGPAERRAQVADEEAVDPDGPRDQLLRYPRGPVAVAGEQRRRQPVPGAVGQRDRLLLAGEGLQGEHGPEYLLGQDLRPRRGP